jgi:DNA invertase Pin-like site-specific DNA recombinase
MHLLLIGGPQAGSAQSRRQHLRSKGKGRLKGRQPKLSKTQRKHLLTLHDAGEHTQAELAELFRVSRTTVYRELQRRTI